MTNTLRICSMTVMVGIATTRESAAQEMRHQTGPQQSSTPAVADCARAQPTVVQTIDAANMRLEAARQQNSPSALRAAMDDLQGALGSLRAQLAPCAALQAIAPADPHAGHAMPEASRAPAKPMAADPHAGHATPKPSPAPTGKPAMKPKSVKPAPAGDPHAGHTTAPKQEAAPEKVMDPVTGLMVDPATAPKETYQGQTYYFSSEQARQEFRQNPAKFAKKPKR